MRTRRPTFAVGVWSASLESSGIFRQEPSAFIVLLQEPLTIGPSKCLNETQWSLLWHSYRTRRRSQGASARVNRPAHVVYRCLRIRTPMNTWGGPYEILWQGRRFWGGGFWGFAIRISVLCDSGHRPSACGGPPPGWSGSWEPRKAPRYLEV